MGEGGEKKQKKNSKRTSEKGQVKKKDVVGHEGSTENLS